MSGNTKAFRTPDIMPDTSEKRTRLRMGRVCPECLGSGRKQIIFSGCFGGPTHAYDRDSVICSKCNGTGVVSDNKYRKVF